MFKPSAITPEPPRLQELELSSSNLWALPSPKIERDLDRRFGGAVGWV